MHLISIEYQKMKESFMNISHSVNELTRIDETEWLKAVLVLDNWMKLWEAHLCFDTCCRLCWLILLLEIYFDQENNVWRLRNKEANWRWFICRFVIYIRMRNFSWSNSDMNNWSRNTSSSWSMSMLDKKYYTYKKKHSFEANLMSRMWNNTSFFSSDIIFKWY